MKIVYASDLHGFRSRYRAVAAVAEEVRPDAIVLGGDLFPDEETLEPAVRARIQPDFVSSFFREWIESVSGARSSLSVGVIFGNHDWITSVQATEELATQLPIQVLDRWSRDRSAASTFAHIGGIPVVGYSYSPPTPWHVKDFECLDCAGDTFPDWGGYTWDASSRSAIPVSAEAIFTGSRNIQSDLSRLTPPDAPWVLVAHAPPFDTGLDRKMDGEPIGSRAVHEAIKKLSPLVSLHGHIHESPRVTGESSCRIGNSWAVNVGQGLGGTNVAVLTIEGDRVASIEPRVVS